MIITILFKEIKIKFIRFQLFYRIKFTNNLYECTWGLFLKTEWI
jgi:hypothetical protein